MDSKGRAVGTSDKTGKSTNDQQDAKTPKAGAAEEAVSVDAVEETKATPTEDVAEIVVEDAELIGSDDDRDANDPDEIEVSEIEAQAEASLPKTTPRQGSFVPLVLGGIVAAAVGFGAAFYLGDQLGFGAQDSEALAALEARLEVQGDQLAKFGVVQSQIGEIAETAQAGVADVADLHVALTNLQAQIETASARVDSFETRLTDIEKRPLTEGLSVAAVAAYEREVEDLKDLVSAQKADAAELKDRADLSAQTALARSATTRIVTALDSGGSYRAAVVDFGAATGQSVPEVLEAHADTGVITLAAMSDTFPEHARAALALARAENVDDAQGSKIGNFLKTHLGARSVEAKDGSDTDAILSRAEAALRAGQLAEALAQLDTLAEGPKAVLSPWRAQADIRLAATRAAEDLAQSQNSN